MYQIKDWDNINPLYWAEKAKNQVRSHSKELKVTAIIAVALGVQAAAYGTLANKANQPVNS